MQTPDSPNPPGNPPGSIHSTGNRRVQPWLGVDGCAFAVVGGDEAQYGQVAGLCAAGGKDDFCGGALQYVCQRLAGVFQLALGSVPAGVDGGGVWVCARGVVQIYFLSYFLSHLFASP
jgi:hypothetical protein